MCQSAIEHYEQIFWVGLLAAPKFGAQKLPIFDDFLTQFQLGGANISSQEHDIDNREMAYFMNFGPLTAKNRIVVFTHPPKSISAWRRRPSRWPAFGVPPFLVLLTSFDVLFWTRSVWLSWAPVSFERMSKICLSYRFTLTMHDLYRVHSNNVDRSTRTGQTTICRSSTQASLSLTFRLTSALEFFLPTSSVPSVS